MSLFYLIGSLLSALVIHLVSIHFLNDPTYGLATTLIELQCWLIAENAPWIRMVFALLFIRFLLKRDWDVATALAFLWKPYGMTFYHAFRIYSSVSRYLGVQFDLTGVWIVVYAIILFSGGNYWVHLWPFLMYVISYAKKMKK